MYGRGTRRSPGRLAVLWVLAMVPALVAFPALVPSLYGSLAAAPHPVRSALHTIPLTSGTTLAAGPMVTSPMARAAGGLPGGPGGPAAGHGFRVPFRSEPRPSLRTGQLSTHAFDVVGLTWNAPTRPAGLQVWIRTRTGGGWTGWHELHGDTEDGPDHPEGRGGTDPYFAGRSDGVQVRVEAATGGLPEGLRVDLIDAGRSPADERLGEPEQAVPGAAMAAVGAPRVVSRSGWGADESIRECCPKFNPTVRVVFVHHTDSMNDYRPEQSAAMVRGIYAFHVRSRGWSDIGYNALVDKYGRVFEGRAGGLTKPVRGAHTGGFNNNSFGVAVIGSLNHRTPTGPTLDALTEVVAWQLSRHRRKPLGTAVLTSVGGGTSRWSAGQRVRFKVISGHRNAGNTDCPGDRLYALLPALRQRVSAAMAAGLVDLSVRTGGGRVSVQFRSLRDQWYTVSIRPACEKAATIIRRGRVGRLAPALAAADVGELFLGRPCGGKVTITVRTTATGGATGTFVVKRTL